MKDPALPPSEGDVNATPARVAWRASLSDRARAALDADERYFLRQSLSTPCLTQIVQAKGAVLTDIDGRRILDFHGNSVHQLGDGHPKVVAAIAREMDTLPFSPRRYANATATTLARRLVETSPAGLDKLLFAPSGAAAVGMALKLARYATGRHKTLSLWDSFHGANLDTIGVGGEALFRRGLGPLTPGAEHLPPLDLARRFFGDDRPFERFADYIDYVLEIQGDVGALIAEPVRWTSVEAPPPDFWPRVRASCTRHGALLIFDEISSCLARTGTLYACEQMGATPDILVVGKGLGGGIMPLAAMLAGEKLDCAPESALGHYHPREKPRRLRGGASDPRGDRRGKPDRPREGAWRARPRTIERRQGAPSRRSGRSGFRLLFRRRAWRSRPGRPRRPTALSLPRQRAQLQDWRRRNHHAVPSPDDPARGIRCGADDPG